MKKPERKIFRRGLRKSALVGFLASLSSLPGAFAAAEVIALAAEAARDGEVWRVVYLGLALVAVLAVCHGVTAALNTFGARLAARETNALRQRAYGAMLGRPLKLDHGTAREKLNDDLNACCGYYSEVLPGVAASAISAAGCFGWLLWRVPGIAWVYLGMAVLLTVPSVIMKNSFRRVYGDCREIEAELTNYIFTGYDGFGDLKLFGLGKKWIEGLRRIHRDYVRIGSKSELFAGVHDAANTTVATVLKYGAYAVAGVFVLWGNAGVGAALASAALAGSFFAAVNGAVERLPSIARTGRAFERIAPWFEMGKEEFSPVLAVNGATVAGVLNNISLRPDPEGITAITGANGSGKSTLLELLAGLIVPTSGRVERPSPEDVAYLPQTEPELGIPAGELLSLLPGAEDLARRFELSSQVLATDVAALSGGERKKVFLSLVFAKKAKYLFLDEPANSLDQKGISVLRELIKERGRGIVFVCHGDALSGLADCVLRVENGEVRWA